LITRDVSHYSVKKKSLDSHYDWCIGAEFEYDVGASGHQASGLERALVVALGKGGREVSLDSHVPGMRATGKSQVAVKTIPSPTDNENRFLRELAISRTFIEGPYRTPTPGNETSDVAKIRHYPPRDQNPGAELRWYESERDTTEQPL
jgi:hypothetical protein